MKMLYLTLIACLALAAQSFSQCTKDIECKFDRICVNGECVPYEQVNPAEAKPVEPAEVVEKEARMDSRDEIDFTQVDLGKRTIWVNPLGFLQFGPTIGFEQRIGDAFYLGAHFRYAAMGLIYTEIVSDYGETEIGMGSAGAGLEGKYYMKFKNNPHSLYYGLFSEFAWGSRTEYEEQYDYGMPSSSPEERKLLYEASHRTVIFGGTVGWRWRLGEERRVLLSLGLLSGVARDIASERTYKNPDQTIEQPLGNTFFGNVEFALGWEF